MGGDKSSQMEALYLVNMVRPKTFMLKKQTSSSLLYWQITVNGNITKVQASFDGGRTKHYPDVEHESPQAAFIFTQKQVQKKRNMGYKNNHRSAQNSTHGDPASTSSYGYSHNKRSHGNDQSPTSRRLWQKHIKTTEENFSDHDTNSTCSMGAGDDDTDSVASTLSRDEQSGISPLNRRRRNLRAGESIMEAADAPHPALLSRVSTTYFLRSQLGDTNLDRSDTVVMQPSGGSTMQRMDTMGKWENWRNEKSQKGPMKTTKNVQGTAKVVDTYAKLLTAKIKKKPSTKPTSTITQAAEQESKELQPCLSHRTSTTTSLRLELTNQSLDDVERPQEGAVLDKSPIMKGRLKRKATTILSPISESPTSSTEKKGPKRGVSKKVLVLSPEESEQRRMSSPKRQATVLLNDTTESLSHKSKKLCLMNPRAMASVRQDGFVYIPHASKCPVNMASPVVWYVPLEDRSGSEVTGCSVYVDNTRCLIAITDGTVLELDADVSPLSGYKLPSGVKCLLTDDDFLYAGCEDGAIYDLTHTDPRMVSCIKGFGQLLCLDVFEGLVAISDLHGNVALINHNGDILWRHKSKGEFGWMVRIDGSGIYHGHSQGITKYSTQDGRQMWHVDLADAVYYGVKTDHSLYVAVGCAVLKMDKSTGKILTKFDKAKSATTTVHSLALGAGLVFAGGKNIVCYDGDSGEVVYVFTHDFKPTHMQYFEGRLFTVGPGRMSVLDLTEATITAMRNGTNTEPVAVTLHPATPQKTPLKKVPTIKSQDSHSLGGIMVECVKPKARRGKLLVKALSTVKNQHWAVQLSPSLQKEGAKYMVQDLRPCPAGNFYRVYGDIVEVD